MTDPTDAEIDALWRFEASKNWDNTLAMRTSFARAVLAKWGQPAQAAEPVATIKSWTNGSYWRNYKVEWHRNDLPKGAQLYTTPQPTQAGAITPPIECNTEELQRAYAFGWWSALEKQRETAQAGAVPLTDEKIDELAGRADYFDRRVFARAIEAEVRKDDEALIRQLVDALEKIDAAMPFPVAKKAIAAGRARLEGKSCPKE